MAIYDYKCNYCQDVFEERVPAEDRDDVVCGLCGNPADRLLTFKGLVWAPTSTSGRMR